MRWPWQKRRIPTNDEMLYHLRRLAEVAEQDRQSLRASLHAGENQDYGDGLDDEVLIVFLAQVAECSRRAVAQIEAGESWQSVLPKVARELEAL